MKNKIIGVVMGGPSLEREVSLATGKAIEKALSNKGYNVILIDLEPFKIVEQLRNAKIDIVFNAVHGKYGEDGLLQGVLEMLNIPYTGSGVLASAIAMNKIISKKIFLSENIPTPKFISYNKNDKKYNLIEEILTNFKLPVVIKSATQGSSVGVFIVELKENLSKAINEAFIYSEQILVENYISGKEISIAIIEHHNKLETLPLIEIIPSSGCYDYYSKYTKGATKYVIPAKINTKMSLKISNLALKAFKALGCHGIARVDVILSNNHDPYILEVNTVPGMTETSLVPMAAATVGIDFEKLCELSLCNSKNKII